MFKTSLGSLKRFFRAYYLIKTPIPIVVKEDEVTFSGVDYTNVYLIKATITPTEVTEEFVIKGLHSDILSKVLKMGKNDTPVSVSLDNEELVLDTGNMKIKRPLYVDYYKPTKMPELQGDVVLKMRGDVIKDILTHINPFYEAQFDISEKQQVMKCEEYTFKLEINLNKHVDKLGEANASFKTEYLKELLSLITEKDSVTIELSTDNPIIIHVLNNDIKYDILLAPLIKEEG